MKLRKDDGSELKKGEYEIDCGDKLFVLEADEEELQIYATIISEKVRPFMEQNMMQQAQIHLLARRLLRLGIPEEELFWAKDEVKEKTKVIVQHFDRVCPKKSIEKIQKDTQEAVGEDTVIYTSPA